MASLALCTVIVTDAVHVFFELAVLALKIA
jgi:hypothetical protein